MKTEIPAFPLRVKKGNSTVTIYHGTNRGYEEFKVAFYQGGKRKLETYNSYAKARRRADTINGDINVGNVERLILTPEERAAYLEAERLVKPVNFSVVAAAASFAQAQAIAGPGVNLTECAKFWAKRHQVNPDKKTHEQILEEFVQSKRDRGVLEKSLYHSKMYIRRFLKACQCDLASIGRDDIRNFLNAQKRMTAGGKNCVIDHLREFYKFAKLRNYVSKECDEINHVEKAKCPTREIEIYTPEEIVSLLNSCGHLFRPLFAICAFAGLRTAEALRLDWRQINPHGSGHIELKAGITKKRQRRLVPIPANLAAWLAPHRKTSGPVWPLAFTSFTRSLMKMQRRTKFKWKKNALRHSYISYRVAETNDAAKVSLEAGNSPEKIFEHYREVVSAGDAQRWFSIMPGDVNDKVVFLGTVANEAKAQDYDTPYTNARPEPEDGQGLTRKEAADLIGVSLMTVKRYMLEDRSLEYYKFENHRVLIYRDSAIKVKARRDAERLLAELVA